MTAFVQSVRVPAFDLGMVACSVVGFCVTVSGSFSRIADELTRVLKSEAVRFIQMVTNA